MIDFAAALYPHHRLAIIGHSLGGQILGLARNISRVDAFVLIASQSGYWRHWPGMSKLRMWLLWWILIPLLSRPLGFFPGNWFGIAELPAPVALSWAKWGRSPRYVCDEHGEPMRPFNHLVNGPIRWISFSDDWIAPLAAVEALTEYYPLAKIERLHLHPSDLGARGIGHFGFFKKNVAAQSWDSIALWLIDALLSQPGDFEKPLPSSTQVATSLHVFDETIEIPNLWTK